MEFGELKHFSHPQHILYHACLENPFKCDGCGQVGIGSRFNCALCNFDLHTHCATASAALRHDFYPKCLFNFFPSPPGESRRYCDACGQAVTGFVYHCRESGYDLHPCCAALPHVINADGGRRLQLHHKASSPCHRCGQMGESWSYRSDCENYNLHVACATQLWLDSWHELYYGGGGSSRGMAMVLGNRLPITTRAAGNDHHRSWKENVKKFCKLAALAVHYVIAAVFGDPTATIAGVVSSLLSQ